MSHEHKMHNLNDVLDREAGDRARNIATPIIGHIIRNSQDRRYVLDRIRLYTIDYFQYLVAVWDENENEVNTMANYNLDFVEDPPRFPNRFKNLVKELMRDLISEAIRNKMLENIQTFNKFRNMDNFGKYLIKSTEWVDAFMINAIEEAFQMKIFQFRDDRKKLRNQYEDFKNQLLGAIFLV